MDCLGLSVHDKVILESNACLSATHISAASKLLKTQFPTQNGLEDTCYLMQKGVWNSSPDDFVQIIYVNPNHWACLSNIFSEVNTIDLYDSAHTIPCKDGSIVKQASAILHELNLEFIQINLINVSPQSGSTDCGLFAIGMAVDGIDPFCVKYQQEAMRIELQSCFEKKKIFPFISKPRKVKKRIIDRFCFVNSTYEEDDTNCSAMPCKILTTAIEHPLWVACDVCNRWYHLFCIGFRKAPRTFVCSLCM